MRPAANPESLTNSSPPLEAPPTAHDRLTRADAAPLTLLMASLIALFWRVIFTPAMFFYRDVSHYTFPHVRFIHDACQQWILPYWNPYVNYGEPVLSNPNFLFFYPYTVFVALLPVELAYTLHFILHFALAAVGTYWLARRWQQSRFAAFFAALVFVFSGPVLSLGNFYNHAACAAWIPWALLLTDRAVESPSLRPWLLLSAVFTLQFLAGEPFTLFATFGLSLALALYRVGALRRPLAAPTRRVIAYFILAGGLMVALSAIQLLPAMDLLHNSRRGRGLTYNQTARWSFHPISLLETVLQDFFGPPFNKPGVWAWVLNWGHDPYFPSVFVGFIPLFFALIGWVKGRDHRRNFVAGAALVFLILSFGRLTPVFALAYLLIPPLELVRFPVKLLVPGILCTALLAGWGFDALRERGAETKNRRRILLPLEVMLSATIAVWLIVWLAPGWFGAANARLLMYFNGMIVVNPTEGMSSADLKGASTFFLTMLRIYLPGLAGLFLGGIMLVLALERRRTWARRAVPVVALLGLSQMALVNYDANPTVPRIFYDYHPPVLKYFEPSMQPYRFYNLDAGSGSPLSQLSLQDYVNFESVPETLGFSTLALGSFRDRLILWSAYISEKVENGNSGDVEGSVSPFVFDLWDRVIHLAGDTEATDRLLGRTNVRYLILSDRQTGPTRREVAQIFNGSSKPGYLFEDLKLVPRAYAAARAIFIEDSGEVLQRLAATDFDALNEVIISGLPADAIAGSRQDDVPGRAGRVEIIDRQWNTVALRAQLSRPAWVVLLDRFDPNWRATVDGREVPILRANQMFRAVRAPTGTHAVRFFYRQHGLKTGAIISLASLALLVTLYAFDPLRPRRLI